MGQHDDVGVIPGPGFLWWWHVSWNSKPGARSQITKWPPSVIGQERMVGGGLDILSRGKPELVDLLSPAGKDMGHRVGAVLEPLVQTPDWNLAGVAGEQLAESHLFVGVCAKYAGGGCQAPRLAQVGQLRSLVGTLLRPTVELAHRDHGTLDLLGQQLHPSAQLHDILLATLHALRRGHQLEVVHDDQLEVVALLESPGLRTDLHEVHVGRAVDEQRRLADLAHPPGQLGPVVVGELPGTQYVQRYPRLRRQQPHDDLDLAHFQREDRTGEVVPYRGGPGEVHRGGRVVRRDHRPPGQIQVIVVVHGHTPDRHARHRSDVDDESRPRSDVVMAPTAFLVHDPLALQPEHVVHSGEVEDVRDRDGGGTALDLLRRDGAPVAQADHQLANILGQPAGGRTVLDIAGRSHRTVGVQQAGEQR